VRRRRRQAPPCETLRRQIADNGRRIQMHMSLTSTQHGIRRELAQRSTEGLDVTLLWCPADGSSEEMIVVCVCDSREGVYFEIPAEPYLALHVYHHPFAYRDFCSIEYQDDRLAA
jgi:hypothetical protein